MPLYTIIADYAGGTYAAQQRARSPRLALSKWAQDSDSAEHIHERQQARREALQRALTDQELVLAPLEGLVGVWCASTTITGRLLILNVIETCEAPNQRVKRTQASGFALLQNATLATAGSRRRP